MRSKFIFAVLIFSFVYSSAQQHLVKLKDKQEIKKVSSIKQGGDDIAVDQMTIMNDKNLYDFIQDLQGTPLKLSYKLDNIPGVVKLFLESFSQDKFTIANPGADWNCCCDHNDRRPNRELICQGNNGHLFMISYFTGGIGTMQNLILVKYNKEKITDFWTGIVQGDLTNRTAIIKSLKNHNFQHWASKTE